MQDNNRKMSEAIEFFETMLDSMPGDRTSLEFLVVAYEQTGQSDKRRKCLIELADTLINEKAFDDADSIGRQLMNNFSSDRDAMLAAKRVNEVVAANQKKSSVKSAYAADTGSASLAIEGDGSFNVPEPGIEVHAHSRAALSAEMDLVWMLKDKEILPREICEELIRALSEFPVNERPQLISALSFLDDQHPEWTDIVMCELQKMSNMPAVPLELFDTENILPSGISTPYMIIRGIVPFAALDNEFLIAILNPLDATLQKDICSRLGTTCHFFLSHPRVSLNVLSKRFDL
jgi:hypothetical protein